MSLISFDNVSFSYESYTEKKTEPVFSSVSFSIKENENVLIIAPPCSGKTTLASICVGITPKFNAGSMDGKVRVKDKSISEVEPYDSFSTISLVPQNAQSYIITTTVEDEIAFPLESLGINREEMEKRIEEALSFWGLEKYREVNTFELSGGETRRLMLSVNEAVRPSLSIYDESFDDLDVYYRNKLREKIKSRENASLVFASHFTHFYKDLFDRIYILNSDGLKEVNEEEIKEQIPQINVITKSGEEYVLSAKNIRYNQKRRSSKDVFSLSVPSFDLKSGEITSLIGPNGSGKSTFSRLLSGLSLENEGEFLLNGIKLSANNRKRNIAYFYQNPDYQIFLPRVRDELGYGLSFTSLSKKEKEEKLDLCASLFNLDLDATSSLLSFGKRKSLQAAIYYLLNRKFYILDELDSALSYEEAINIIQLLHSNNSGILLISHDYDFASSVSSTVYKIEEGLLSEY